MIIATVGTLLFIGIAVIIAVSTVLSGYVLAILWGWFIVPLGLAQIGIAHAIGIFATARLIAGGVPQRSPEPKQEPLERLGTSFIVRIGFPLLTWLLGWIAHSFM